MSLIRLETSDQGALGVLLLDGEAFCCTLEPDAADPVKFQIPKGSYWCRRFHGPKWPNTFEIMVPGHTAILFHAGNVEAHTTACILLGSSFGKLKGEHAVLNSGVTFTAFLERTKEISGFNLFIEEHIPA
jgi:hypothetical protein